MNFLICVDMGKTVILPTFSDGSELVCGCDEAGRGPLAGPVVAAAVILPAGFSHPLLADSKQLNAAGRAEARKVVEDNALAFGIGILDHAEIDAINILKASFKAMHAAIGKMKTVPDRIIVDGNQFMPYGRIPYDCIVKGDGKYAEIAAASILAKTCRDGIMEELHDAFPQYNWRSNKGYPTREHRDAIREYGPSPFHRMSFKLLPDEQLELFD